ncbi:hypothetical protein K3495_g17201, partial [Podosphaera aphanis]
MGAAEPLVAWMDENGFDLATGQNGVPTHDRGHVLDLVLASGSLLAMETQAAVAPHLDVTSDHRPILTLVPWDPRHKESTRNFQLKSFDPEVFNPLLADNLRGLAPLPNQPNTAALDEHAQALSGCIHRALEGSAKRANADNLGNSWWTPECREARRTYKHSEKGVLDR